MDVLFGTSETSPLARCEDSSLSVESFADRERQFVQNSSKSGESKDRGPVVRTVLSYSVRDICSPFFGSFAFETSTSKVVRTFGYGSNSLNPQLIQL